MTDTDLPDDDRPIWERIADLGESLPDDVVAKMPTDGASQLNHYVYGSQKKMTAPANNDTRETPKPPEGFKGTLLDWAVEHWVAFTPVAHWEQQKDGAIAELSALRAKAAAYDEAMRRVWERYHELIIENPNGSEARSTRKYLRGEIESGRFKP